MRAPFDRARAPPIIAPARGASKPNLGTAWYRVVYLRSMRSSVKPLRQLLREVTGGARHPSEGTVMRKIVLTMSESVRGRPRRGLHATRPDRRVRALCPPHRHWTGQAPVPAIRHQDHSPARRDPHLRQRRRPPPLSAPMTHSWLSGTARSKRLCSPVSGPRGTAGTRPSPRRCERAGGRRRAPGGSRSCPRSPGPARAP